MNKIKDWMARNQDNVSQWSDICVLVLCLSGVTYVYWCCV